MSAVLVLNAGSSTIKYRLVGEDRVLGSGIVERIGEDGARVCAELGWIGVRLDDARNAASGSAPRTISTDDSAVAVLVVPTDEEGEIARQARATCRAQEACGAPSS